MERMTYKEKSRCEICNVSDNGNCLLSNVYPCDEYKRYARLAAYEDTGLSPEEIEKIRDDVDNGCMKSVARRYGICVDRLRALAAADRDGCCLVISCKIGDKVYVVDNGDYESKFKPYVREKIVTEINWKKNRNGKDLGYGLILKGGRYGTSVRCNTKSIGKTVFLNREAAEKALNENRRMNGKQVD